MQAEKQRLRRAVRAARQARPLEQRERDAVQIAAHLIALVSGLDAAKPIRVACFLSTDLEPGTRPFLDWARANGVEVLLPVAREDGLLDWVIDTGREQMHPELHVPEPVGEAVAPIEMDAADLILVPAALVARDGTRLGWGGGYFDRLLGSSTAEPLVLAVVHDEEVVDALPRASHDMPVAGAVTPSGVVRFSLEPR